MPAIAKAAIHARILAAVGGAAAARTPVDAIPFVMEVKDLGPIAFYAFTLTSPPGGRPTGEYKVQLIVPGQGRGERGTLYLPASAFTIVAGWSQSEDVFALWDAYAHSSFAYSQNLQVKGRAVWRAGSGEIQICERRLRRERGIEKVVVCRADHLLDGLKQRLASSAERLSVSSQP